jgi:hypothetical protein
MGNALFPKVKPDWWCGEYRPHPAMTDTPAPGPDTH